MENEALIQKTLTTAAFLSGGQLNPEQQSKFVVYIRKYANLLGLVRYVPMPQSRMTIDKMYVGSPITQGASENSDNSAKISTPKLNSLSLSATKVTSGWNTSTEFLQDNIEKDGFEDTLFEAMSQRIAQDLELLGIQGDDTISGTDEYSLLLKVKDGWLKKALGGHVLDCGGAEISWNLFRALWEQLPKHARQDPGLRFFVSDTALVNWQAWLKQRETAGGDKAIETASALPLNIPFLKLPNMPDRELVAAGGASPAQVIGTNSGPFTVTSTTNKVKVDIDNAGAVTVTLTAGVFLPTEIAQQINDAYVTAHGATYGAIARDDGIGRIFFVSPTTGTTSEVDIQAVANDAYDALGLTEAVTSGEASGDVFQGTKILLANPKNLVFGMLDGTRVFGQFNMNYDRLETRVFNQIEYEIEDLDAVAIATNVKLLDPDL